MTETSPNSSGREPLAITGIGCRLPGGVYNPEDFWKLLINRVSAVSVVPEDRWNWKRYYATNAQLPSKMITKWGAFLDNKEEFDARFFGISPREALRMDPQQRWLLESAWEAMEDGGSSPDKLRGKSVGVFVGIASNDYAGIQHRSPVDVDVHTNSGSTLSIASGRISYLLDLKGPSVSVDTACSSALVAINLACQNIWDGACESALAGGSNALLTPDSSIGFSKASMLSPSGKCFAFDSRANGYVRGEGAGMFMIKPLKQAEADGDPIYCVIRAAVVNQDGNTSSMTVPGIPSQKEMLDIAYEECGIDKHDVFYVEAHGTGTPVGDPIETRALGEALSQDRPEGKEMLIGSVKTNVGHLESGSGVAGVLKAALALKHRLIPPNLNFKKPSPNIDFKGLKLKVVTEPTPLPNLDKPVVMAVNSFGFGGTNSHIVLEEAPRHLQARPARVDDEEPLPYALPVSGRNADALKANAASMRDYLRDAERGGQASLKDIIHTATTRRAHHDFRIVAIGSSHEEIADKLDDWLAGEKKIQHFAEGKNNPDEQLEAGLIFTGQGPQWFAMGREMLEKDPVFRAKMEEIDSLIQDYAGWSVIEELKKSKEESQIGQTKVAQPAIFALQVSLAEVWKSRGIKPIATVGHSVGEAAAAYVSGIYSLKEGVQVIIERSLQQQKTHGTGGGMYAVGMTEDEAKELIKDYEGRIEIAAVNSPALITLSGDDDALAEAVKPAEEKGLFVRSLRVNYAFHSFHMEPIKETLLEALKDVKPHAPQIPLYSTVTGEKAVEGMYDAEYWWKNVRYAVAFAPAVMNMIADGVNTFIELGPHPSLASSLNECLAEAKKKGVVVPSLNRKDTDRARMLTSFAELYCAGYDTDWDALYGEGNFIPLPIYEWQREKYWLESDDMRDYRLADFAHPLLGLRQPTPNPTWERLFDVNEFPYIDDHRLRDSIVYPASAYCEMALAAGREIFEEDELYAVEDVVLEKAMFFQDGKPLSIRFSYDLKSMEWQIHSSEPRGRKEWDLHARGRLIKQTPRTVPAADLEAIKASMLEQNTHKDIYGDFSSAGYQFGHCFSQLKQSWRNRKTGEAIGQIEVPPKVRSTMEEYIFQPAVLDAAFQCMKGAQDDRGRKAVDNFYLPVGVARIRMFKQPGSRLFGHSRLYVDDGEKAIADITVYDDQGDCVAEIKGFHAQRVEQGEGGESASLEKTLYKFEWEQQRLHKGGEASEHFQAPSKLLDKLSQRAKELFVKYDGNTYFGEYDTHFKLLGDQAIINAFLEIGWNPQIGDTFTQEDIMKELKILDTHERLTGSILKAMAANGIIESTGEKQWKILTIPEAASLDAIAESITSKFPKFDAEVPLQLHCNKGLGGVLTGKTDPIELIFGGKSEAMLDKFYKQGTDFVIYNQLIASSLADIVASVPEGKKLRVLEVGAGTGSLTKAVLPSLPQDRVEFTFTDISPKFTSDAKNQFDEYSNIDYRVLDIEKDCAAQGIEPHAFDIVLGTNVIHATANVTRTLQRVRRLLAEDGMLIFLDVTRPRLSLDLVFGLLKGWWLYEDTDLRPESALMEPKTWLETLGKAGYRDPQPLFNSPTLEEASQTVFYAQAGELDPVIDAELASTSDGDTWLIFPDQQGAAERITADITARNQKTIEVNFGDSFLSDGQSNFTVRANAPEDYRALIETINLDSLAGVIHLSSLDHPLASNLSAEALEAAQQNSTVALTLFSQAMIEKEPENTPRMWVVTRGAQSVNGEELSGIASSPIMGLLRVARNEHPDYIWTSLDLDATRVEAKNFESLSAEIFMSSNETEIAWRDGIRYVHRLHRTTSTELPIRTREARTEKGLVQYRLENPEPGKLSAIHLAETDRQEPGTRDIEIEVKAAGLNFRDVMKSLGIYPGENMDQHWYGDECSGTIVRVGKSVKNYKVGDNVVAMVPYCFRGFATINQSLAFPKPDNISFEDGATLPIVFLTAHYCLHEQARIQKGEKVLIHAAAGGVGQAAIQVAMNAGAEIHATASPGKHEFLRSLGVKHIYNSRTLDFADEIMEATDGYGVDIVLNSLAGDFIPKSIKCLAKYGRFVEIGKVDIYGNSKIGLEPFQNNLTFYAVDLAMHLNERPKYVAKMLKIISKQFESGKLKPLRHDDFPITEADEAFRHMAQAKHIGKVVISMDAAKSIPVSPCTEAGKLFKPDVTYLITGGLGGFGLEVAQWICDNGAKNLALVGRSGARSKEAKAVLKRLRKAKNRVEEVKGDMTLSEDVDRVVNYVKENMPPLRGVIHGAMVLDDAFIMQLNEERLYKVLKPKMTGGWLLHNATLDCELDHFICFSSISSVIGGAGQGNYAAANYFLDALCNYRKSLGLPALAINWGALGGAGAVARDEKIAKYLENLGLEMFEIEESLEIFKRLLPRDAAQVGASKMEWKSLSRMNPGTSGSPTYSLVTASESEGDGSSDNSSIRPRVLGAADDQRLNIVQLFITEQVAAVFGTGADKIDRETPLTQIGLDSLMAIELMNRLEAAFAISLPMGKFLQGPSINQLGEDVLELVLANADDSDFEAAAEDGMATSGTVGGAELVKTDPGVMEFALSRGQRALWFLHQLAPNSPAYNLTFTSKFTPFVDIPMMERAFKKLFVRHPMLDVVFEVVDGEPIQRLRDSDTIDFLEHDCTSMSEEEVKEQILKRAHAPFNLKTGPVIRLDLFRTKSSHYTLLSMHHIVSDAWSVSLILRDLMTAYFSEKGGIEPEWEPLEFRYPDYIQWQETLLAGPKAEEARDYWIGKLDGVQATLDLPTDNPRPAMQTFNGATHGFKLAEDITSDIIEFANQQGVTLFTFLHAGYQVLLNRYTGQDDIVVGSPLAARGRPEFHEMVGYFINMAPIRGDFTTDPKVSDLLEDVSASVIEALEQQDYPLVQVIEDLKLPREPSRSPLFQVGFSMERIPGVDKEGVAVFLIGQGGHKFEVGDFEVESVDLTLRMAPLEITLVVEEVDGNIYGCWQYNSDLFKPETIAQLSSLYESLLKQMTQNPEKRISELQLVTEEEQNKLLGDWNATDRGYDRDNCLHEIVDNYLASAKEDNTVIAAGESLGYRELSHLSYGVANDLVNRGIKLEEPVAVMVDRSVQLPAALLGSMMSGGCYLPLDPGFPDYRIEQILESAKPRFAILDRAMEGKYGKRFEHVIYTDEFKASENAPAVSGLTSDKLAYIIYTSGSTGKPKGVEIPHRATVNFLESMQVMPGLTSDDSLLAVTTVSFDIHVLEIFLPLMTGANLVIATKEEATDARRLMALIDEFEITVMQATPATWRSMIDNGWTGNKKLKSLCGGEQLPRDLANGLLENSSEAWNLYGPTETTVWSTVRKVTEGTGTVSIGSPIANTRVYILDDEDQLQPAGFTGHLCIAGDGLASGYHNAPELTGAAFSEVTLPNGTTERIYRTGDLARWTTEGELEFFGRSDFQVKLRGFRIELGDIEAQLKTHKSVLDAVVALREDMPGGPNLAAYIVTEGKADLKQLSADLRAICSERLPDYMRPAAYMQLDALPLTPNRKVDRKRLPKPEVERDSLGSSFVAPRTPSEHILCDILNQAFETKEIGIRDNFFELGGDSLMAVRILGEIAKAFNREVAIEAFLRTPTVETLAAWLDTAPPESAALSTAGARSLDIDTIEHLNLEFVAPGEKVSYPTVDAVALAYVPDGILPVTGLSREQLLGDWFGNKPFTSNVYETPWGNIGLVLLPMLGADLYKHPEMLHEQLGEALHIAGKLGARHVSLTGLIPSATQYGATVPGKVEGNGELPVVTTGHATTTATVVLNLAGMLEKTGRDLTQESVAFVGLGSIGTATLRLMLDVLPHPHEIILTDLYQKAGELEGLQREIVNAGFKGNIRIEPTRGQLPEAVYSASIIMGATNVPSIVDIERLLPGTLLIDDSAPPCFRLDEAVRRVESKGDILFTTSGILRFGSVLKETLYVPTAAAPLLETVGPAAIRTIAGRDGNELTGCILASLLTGVREEIRPVIGEVKTSDSRANYAVLKDLNLSAALMQCEGYVIADDKVTQFKETAKKPTIEV